MKFGTGWLTSRSRVHLRDDHHGNHEEKGYVRRKKEGKTYIYSPRIGADATKNAACCGHRQRVYDGSTLAAMVNLLETADVEADELKQLRELIKKKSEE